MKKLFTVLAVLSSFFQYSQGNSCATATDLTSNGTYVCPTITSGIYQPLCFAADIGINAKWYKLTPSTNGVVFISSNFEVNAGINTRLSVMTGSCGSLTCFAENDDFNPLAIDNRLSTVQIAVQAGITYFIQWDSRWDIASFEFEYSFVASNCLPIDQFAVSNPLSSTSTTTTLRWNNAIGNPENYLIEWTPDFAPASSSDITTVPVVSDSGNFSTTTIDGLPAGENISYFISSLCGTAPNYTGQSIRKGPFFSFLAKNLPYSVNFDSDFPVNNFTDGFIGFPFFLSDDFSIPSNYADGGAGGCVFTFNSPSQSSNIWGYSRAINLNAGQQVTITFKSRLFAFEGEPAPMSVVLSAGLSQAQSTQNNFISSFNINTSDNYTTHTAVFTAPTTDVYYFGFKNNSAPGNETFAFFDTFSFTTAPLSTEEFLKQQLKIYPIPASDIVSFSNNQEDISKIEIIDLNGRIVKQIIPTDNRNSRINIAEIKEGVYAVRATTSKGVTTQKLIKN